MKINQQTSEMINELSGLCGILPEYWDIFGKLHVTTVEAKQAMLRAMKIPVETHDDIAKEIHKRETGLWKSFTGPVFVVSVNVQPLKIPVYIPLRNGEENKIAFACVIEDENKTTSKLKDIAVDIDVLEERTIDGIRYVMGHLFFEEPGEIGYYTVTLECKLSDNNFPNGTDTIKKKIKLIITPDTCYIPQDLVSDKAWGISVNLYALHSRNSWGIGDFKDLKSIADLVSENKGDFLGVNPLHAIPNTYPYGISPYSPISRLYRNFIYLDIEDVPEVIASKEIQLYMKAEDFRNKIDKLCKSGRIDYEQTGRTKKQILRCAFDFFYEKHYKKNTKRKKTFGNYVSSEGDCLESFATFLALQDFYRKNNNTHTWQEWPKAYHDPCGDAVKAFRQAHEKEVLFYMYIQWLIDDQLMRVSDHCSEIGMKIGLYHDLAIGAIAGGSDVWSYQEIIGDADVGAPPDDFNPNGQNWGFPPIIPEKLIKDGYKLFVETIRKNMRYGGALRIDHALGLYRMFWIPNGMSPKDGAYLLQPAEDLLRIIALESWRNKTIVIAEDLGTIDDEFREMLQSFQMLSYRLFYFERNYPAPDFKSPDQYPTMALCAITTHDLPTIYGYWAGRDIEVKKQLGFYGNEEVWKNDVIARERDKELILQALKEQGLFPGDYAEDSQKVSVMTHELCLAIYRYLAKSPGKLLLVSLDDILGTVNQQNFPGTVDSHPNWIQKTPVSIEEMLDDKRFSGLQTLIHT